MRSRKFALIISYFNTFVSLLLGVFVSSFTLRTLGETDYGVYKSIASFVNYLVLFDFGVGTVVTRNLSICLAENAPEEKIRRTTSTMTIIVLMLAFGMLVVASIFYFNIPNVYKLTFTQDQIIYGKRIFIWLTILLVVSFLNQSINAAILSYELYGYGAVLGFLTMVARALMVFVIIGLTKKSIYLAVIDVIIAVSCLLFALYLSIFKCKMKFSLKYFDVKLFKEALPLSFAMLLQTMVNQANTNVDNFVLGVFVSPESVSVYSIGIYIYTIFSQLTSLPITMYMPQVTKDLTRLNGDMYSFTDTLSIPCRLATLIGGTVLFGFIVVGRQFITILYGEAYLNAWYVAIIIMGPMLINMSNGVLVNALTVLNKRLSRSLVLSATTVLNIILTLIFIRKYGMLGACVATAIATLIGQDFLMNIYYNNVIKIRIPHLFKISFKGILLNQIIACICGLIVTRYISNVWISFFAGGFTYVIVFGILFLTVGKNKDEKIMIREFLKKYKIIHD